jgi:amino acid transporter
LVNFIMASRLIYGMADQGQLPRALAAVHAGRRTPWVAVLLALGICLTLVATGGVAVLAKTTSLLLVAVFATLHAGLIVLRRREPATPGLFRAPAFVPWAGLAVSALLAFSFPPGVYLRAGAVAAAGLLLHWALSSRSFLEERPSR